MWDREPDIALARRSAPHKGGFQTHRFRSWLTEEEDPQQEEKIVEGCQVSGQAAERATQGERTISMDELTGVQALERKHLYLPPMLPGHVLRREFESLRHGPLCWSIHLEVATGQILEPSSGPTRGEQDCVAHLRRLGDSAPDVKRWHLMRDHVDTHRALALVRWKADLAHGMRNEM
jgi:hypothetical protein